MRRGVAALLAAFTVVALLGCDEGPEGPRGLPTGPTLQTPVPPEPGDPAPTVIPMPPQEPGTAPPGDRGAPETLIPTVQP